MRRTDIGILSRVPPEEGSAYLEYGEKHLLITNGDGEGFITMKEAGNVIAGPTTIMAEPEGISILGLYTLNPALLMGVPSTASTPIPVLIPRQIGALSANMLRLIAEAVDTLEGM
jgi:hypothetical protein